MSRFALTGAKLVTPDGVLESHSLLIADGRIEAFIDDGVVPIACPKIELDGGWIVPGFIDTQVNGGGDVLFNDKPTLDGVRAIAEAHRRYGTTGLLPTLISDDPDVVDAAMDAIDQAIEHCVPGVLGIHIEGPHLNPEKRGIHDASKFTLLDDAILDRLTRPTKGVRLVTIAPELAPTGAIRRLVDAGVIVAAGHSMAGYDETRSALDEGLSAFTHLFNAMTQLGSREPGMVGAALEDHASRFGLIVDGLHVHPATLRLALAARGIDGAMLVTDAMPPVGGTTDRFMLMGREIRVVNGTCRGPEGTLAGSALSMSQAFRNALDWLGHSIEDVSRMASANPAALLGLQRDVGTMASGQRADLVHLSSDRRVARTWIAGMPLDRGE